MDVSDHISALSGAQRVVFIYLMNIIRNICLLSVLEEGRIKKLKIRFLIEFIRKFI